MGLSLRTRNRAITAGATAASAVATAFGVVCIWIVWFVAPWCLGDANLISCTAGQAGSNAVLLAVEIAALEWGWMLGVALIARFAAERSRVQLSG